MGKAPPQQTTLHPTAATLFFKAATLHFKAATLSFKAATLSFKAATLSFKAATAFRAVLVLIAALLAGCGGGGNSDPASPPVAQTPTPPSPAPPEPTAAEINTASRFTAQATFGMPYEEIIEIARTGPEAWLDAQITTPMTLHTPLTAQLLQRRLDGEFESIEDDVELLVSFRRYSWWHHSVTAPDDVRQRVALALSEIMVVSDQTDTLLLYPFALSTYYDTLLAGAFGNYRDLLRNVALHPAMGFYLSHLNNAKANSANNTFPDENFAREVMQLFSIGLFELNNDGSRKRDVNGQPIPTYNNQDIREFAKLFTGLSWGGDDAFFGKQEPRFSEQMQMFDDFHEPGEKRLLNGTVVPAGQTGLQDLDAGIDNLFNHPNTGPFIARLLIQRLVTSNPSPAYIARVAQAFNNNAAGVRGDMANVVRAILLDSEARNPPSTARAGKVREPLVRNVAFLRQLNPRSTDSFFFNSGFFAQALMNQGALSAPSVFNFFLPDHQPAGALAAANLLAPELEITTSTTIAGITNLVDIAVNGEFAVDVEPPFGSVTLDLSEFETLASDPAALVDRLDVLFTYGQMSTATKSVIVNILNEFPDPPLRAKTAIYMVLISPDYAVRI